MIEIKSELKAWRRSVGIVVPKEAVRKESLKEGDMVKLLILKKSNPLKDTFGKLKFKKTTDEILKRIDWESWDE